MSTRVRKSRRMDITKPHYGRRIALLRNIHKLSQGQLGDRTGYKQQDISEFESKQELPDEILEILAKGLDTSVTYIKEMDENGVGTSVFYVQDQGHGNGNFNTNNFNPVDKILELVEENKKLYERLLAAEKALLAAEKEKADMQQQVIALQKDAIAALQQTNQALQDLLGNTKA
ncbi:hypothetical protein SAMN05216436_115133 [bacterium A37T11]|nr:hypothetical protein SAMN05216436_115133 [bacterium A37T11]